MEQRGLFIDAIYGLSCVPEEFSNPHWGEYEMYYSYSDSLWIEKFVELFGEHWFHDGRYIRTITENIPEVDSSIPLDKITRKYFSTEHEEQLKRMANGVHLTRFRDVGSGSFVKIHRLILAAPKIELRLPDVNIITRYRY